MDKEKNYEIFLKKLNQFGIDTEILNNRYGELIRDASFTLSNDNGMAYEGSLVDIVLKVLTGYAVRINELLPKEKQVDKSSLVKVCLLHHISKAVRIIKNDNAWEIEKKNLIYKYDDNQPAIRTGLHSLAICQSCGIPFTIDEVEAMTINDRDLSDNQARYHSNIMSLIVRQANEMTYMQYQ
jgi:hypothetical protein